MGAFNSMSYDTEFLARIPLANGDKVSAMTLAKMPGRGRFIFVPTERGHFYVLGVTVDGDITLAGPLYF